MVLKKTLESRWDSKEIKPVNPKEINLQYSLEKEMATHSTILAWRIPGTGEPVGLLSVGSHKVGHD